MSPLIIVKPLPIAAVTVSRGTGGPNLATRDPKEVWADSAAGSPATLTIDFGAVVSIDTILLGAVRPPAAGATWSIAGGVGSANTPIAGTAALRVPDVLGNFAETSHALWRGNPISIRYLAITVTQPAGAAPLTAGLVVAGRAFVAQLGQEWGAGRQPVDTGSATSLPSGGFAVVEGAIKSLFGWSFGDLSRDETDQLELIANALGLTRPGLVIEDASPTTGLRARIHYGLFKKWGAFERRNPRQTRWEISIEQWI